MWGNDIGLSLWVKWQCDYTHITAVLLLTDDFFTTFAASAQHKRYEKPSCVMARVKHPCSCLSNKNSLELPQHRESGRILRFQLWSHCGKTSEDLVFSHIVPWYLIENYRHSSPPITHWSMARSIFWVFWGLAQVLFCSSSIHSIQIYL